MAPPSPNGPVTQKNLPKTLPDFAVLPASVVYVVGGGRLSDIVDDSEQIRKALEGDQEAFTALCEQNRVRLWRIIASVTHGSESEDLAQEAIVRAYCALQTYRAEASFAAWLCRIAINVAHDYQKSAWQRRVLLSQETDERRDSPMDGPEEIAARREMQRRIRQAVAALPAAQRVPIWLHYFEEFSLAEVARLESISESTVRSRVQAGLRRLALSLDDLLTGSEPSAAVPQNAKGCEA
jgi:RNA polymerase sigma-70 factor (ECF subfamily)